MRVVELSQLERVDAELCGELVEQALERPRALDEAGRAESGHRRQVQLGSVLDRAHVVAGVEQLHGAGRRHEPAVPPERAGVLAAERGERAVRAGGCGDVLPGRVAVPADDVLVAARDGAARRAPGPLRELGGEQDGVVEACLRAEAAAHELADDAHLVGRQPERRREVVAGPPDPLGRDVDVERVPAPLADALVRLERVVVERLRAVLGLDDHVGHREPGLVVAALVERVSPRRAIPAAPPRRRRAAARAPPTRRRSAERPPRPARTSRPRRQRPRSPRSSRRESTPRTSSGPITPQHAGCGRRGGEVDPLHAAARERAAQEGGVQRSRQLEVARVARDRREPSRSRRDAPPGGRRHRRGPAGHWSSASSSTSVQTSS